jgi:hypothetical protein
MEMNSELMWDSMCSDVAEARKSARKDKRKVETHNGTNGTTSHPHDDDENEDLEAEERDWPFQVARIGDNSSIAYWEFTEWVGLPVDTVGKERGD